MSVAASDPTVDISKILVIPPKLTLVWNFSFSKDDMIKCDYTLKNNGPAVQPVKFTYPGPGDTPNRGQMVQKFSSFVAFQNHTGSLQFDEFFSNQSLTNLLAQYTKMPTAQDDKYLQFKKDDLLNTIIVITDKDEQKVLYRLVVPKVGDMTQAMLNNFKASCKARGQTDDEIAQELPKFQAMLAKNTAFTAQMTAVNAKSRFGTVETYSYAP